MSLALRVVIACVLVALGLSANQSPPRRPNILLAVADDWSWPHAGAYGDPATTDDGRWDRYPYYGEPAKAPAQ